MVDSNYKSKGKDETKGLKFAPRTTPSPFKLSGHGQNVTTFQDSNHLATLFHNLLFPYGKGCALYQLYFTIECF